MTTLAERLQLARRESGMTQPELAEKSGISQQMISKLERGKSADTSAIVPLARALNVSTDWLYDGTGPMQRRYSFQTMAIADLVESLDPKRRPQVQVSAETQKHIQDLESGVFGPTKEA